MNPSGQDAPSGHTPAGVHAGSEPDPEQAALPDHERIYQQAMARIAAIEEEWAQALEGFTDRGQQQ